MKSLIISFVLIGCGSIAVIAVVSTPNATSDTGSNTGSNTSSVELSLPDKIAEIAKIKEATPEETYRKRNIELNRLFQKYTQTQNGKATGPAIQHFHGLIKQAGLTSFDDFQSVMLTPLRYVNDPDSGEKVPVFGPLGTDVINPWLAAMGVSEGKPLDEQSMYILASDVLREHIDFAVIGTRDPNLSFELLPPELRENAKWAYRRLNPTNRFDGGFDHPLFYATIREAVKKLFRKDHPSAKLTMADVVLSPDQGGLGIKSCLLCHNRNYNGVYARLIGQSLFFQTKVDLANEEKQAMVDGSDDFAQNSQELKQAQKMTAMFQLAADRVLEKYSDKIDPGAVKAALGSMSPENLNNLKPGFDDFYETLDNIGCTTCHSSLGDPPAEKNPAKYKAFVLTPNNYFKTRNIIALAKLINLDNLNQSKLLMKPEGKVKHRGSEELELDETEIQELRKALYRWVHSLDVKPGK